jgi:hypothetical protein
MRAWGPAAAVAAAAFVLTAGLGCPQPSRQQPPSDRFDDAASLGADRLPADTADLILTGTRIPVELKGRREGQSFVLEVLAHGEVVETETYVATDRQFGFASLSGESFEPPIPLVEYPFQVGDSRQWSGKAVLGPTGRPAKAAVTTSHEKLNLASGALSAIQVAVELEVVTGPKTTAGRRLTFWLVPQKGVVRREFGSSSLREPRDSEDPQP